MIASGFVPLVADGFAPVDQDYLFEARQMQALSFAVHIPLVCFGVAFPAFVLFVEWLHLRTGDPLYRVLARRWSKVMLALFAVGVVTGTILSFEIGLLWPDFMATFGDVFGLGFAIEGFSFFVEAIFIAIYVYGWDRLSPRAHFLTGIPIVLSGFTGSLIVIAVNGWMNHPRASGSWTAGRRRASVRRRCSRTATSGTSSSTCTSPPYIVAGFLIAGAYAWAWLRGRCGRYDRTALVIPLTFAALAAPGAGRRRRLGRRARSPRPARQARGVRGAGETQRGAPIHLLGWYDATARSNTGSDPELLSLLAFHDPNAAVQGLDAVPAEDRPPVNVVRFAFQTMVGDRHRSRAARRGLPLVRGAGGGGCRARRGSTAPCGRRAAVGRRADRRLGHDRGRPPALGRLPGDAHLGGGHGRRRHPGRLRDARRSSTRACRGGRWVLRRLARAPLEPEAGAWSCAEVAARPHPRSA